MAESGMVVETLLAYNPPLIKEAWCRIKGWYKIATNSHSAPARVMIEQTTEERVSLYWWVPPPGDSISI